MRSRDTYACTTAKPPGGDFADLRELLDVAATAVGRYARIADYVAAGPEALLIARLSFEWPPSCAFGDHAETEEGLTNLLRSRLPALLREVFDEASRKMECALADLERALVERRQGNTGGGE